MNAYEIDGIDVKEGVVVVEINKSILPDIWPALINADDLGEDRSHVAIRSLGANLRRASKVLNGFDPVEKCGFDLLDDECDDEDEYDREASSFECERECA